MRFSCIMAIIVLCVGLSSTHQRTVLAQPYQKVWSGPSQHGMGIHQKHHGYAPGAACQPPCYPPCGACQPKDAEPPGGPKDATRNEPRAAVPGIAPGVFVSPPQSGVVEGPSRGFEIGDISLTLPEIKLGFPRLRCVGIKHFSRDARMMTDRAAAPYVGNPYYAMAQAQVAAANREAEGPDDGGSKEPGKKKGGDQGDTARGTCQSDLEMRIQRLEGCFEMQVQALQSCVEELRALRSAESAYQKSSTYVPSPPPCNATEARSDVHIRSPQPLPPMRQVMFGEGAARTNYEVVAHENAAPRSVPLRRLPAATQ